MVTTHSKHEKVVDVTMIKLLYKVSYVLGLSPGYNFNVINKRRKGCDWYVICMMIFIAGLAGLSFKGRIDNTYPFTPNITDILLDGCNYISMTITNVVSCFSIRLCNSDKVIGLLNEFKRIDGVLKITDKRIRSRYHKELVFYGLLYLIYAMYTFNFWNLAVGFKGNWPYMFVILQRFHALILALLIHNIALLIKYRFVHLNKILETYLRKEFPYELTIHQVNNVHKRLFMMFRTFNHLFGSSVICLCTNFTFGCLHPINSIILQVMKGNVLSGIDFPHFNLHYVSVTTMMTLNTLVFTIPISTSCKNAYEAGLQFLDTARRLQISVSDMGNKNKMDLMIYGNQIANLTNETKTRYPYFSANAFYKIDHTLMLGLLGAISSYLIIFIQLNLTTN